MAMKKFLAAFVLVLSFCGVAAAQDNDRGLIFGPATYEIDLYISSTVAGDKEGFTHTTSLDTVIRLMEDDLRRIDLYDQQMTLKVKSAGDDKLRMDFEFFDSAGGSIARPSVTILTGEAAHFQFGEDLMNDDGKLKIGTAVTMTATQVPFERK